MKKLTTLILLFHCVMTFAQNTYEVFQYDGKYGVVNTSTLTEFVEPKFENWNDWFKDAVALRNGQEYTFYNKTTGKDESFTNTEQGARFNSDYHMHFLRNGKTVLIPRETKNMLFFDRRFDEMKGSGGDLIVKYNNIFDVYAKPDFKTPKIKNIEATKIYDGQIFRKRTQKSEYVTIFYGKEAVFVYDKNFNLLKKYNKAANYDTQMYDVIANEFEKVNELNEEYGVMAAPDYWQVSFKDGYTTITSQYYRKSFTIKGDFNPSTLYGNHNFVYLKDKTNQKRYAFIIDYDKKQFQFPKKYQEELQLKFVD